MMSEADVDGAAVEVEPFYLYSITFCCSVIAAAAGRCDKMMEVHIKQSKKWCPLTFMDAF